MNDKTNNTHNAESVERLTWWFATGLTAVFLTCMHMATTPTFKLASLDKLVRFEAVEPFQHRVLLPSVVASIQRVLPLGEVLLFGLLEVAGWVALIVLAHRALVCFRVGRSEFMRRMLAFTVVVPMMFQLIVPDFRLIHPPAEPSFALDFGTWRTWPLFYYAYDLPAAVLTLAMALVLAREYERPTARGFTLYFGLFALATLNRETAVFMLPLFALLFWSRLSMQRWLGLLALQAGLFVAIQLPLHWLFEGNVNPNGRLAGTNYEYHLIQNLGLFASPLYLMLFAARFTAGLYLPVLLWRRYLDRRLAAALLGFCLPLIAFAFLAGRVVEHRIFIEIAPLMWISALQVIAVRSHIAVAAERPVDAQPAREPMQPDTREVPPRPAADVPVDPVAAMRRVR